MGRVAIVADSSVCLPRELVERYGIGIVPLGLTIDGRLYHDGSLDNAELFRLIEASRHGPKTASAAPGAFVEAFARERDAGAASVLCLTLSAGFSGTYGAAMEGAKLAADRLPGLEVRVVDTGGLAMTHGFAVLAAARAAEVSGCLDEAAYAATRVGHAGRLLGSLDTMRFVVKGGRVPWVLGWAASLLHIKPVFAFEGGSARSIARPRTWAVARDQVLRRMSAEVRGGTLRASVMHVDALNRAQELASEVQSLFSPVELIITEFTSVMAAHTGPGFVGVGWYEEA
ncbi:MAG: DegV family protein [Chloroflexota bacterium]